ncbi:50S ribosomal protein L24 [bacterium]|jgi:large subunit ribosomal protein L24|nr:50S ribosomal protein L24 [bacterium]MDP6571305.1 50S ribosomal protein L24 [Patescibacteria group bacterium]|tara:strand:- start:4384 stop:4695 length:312 start_codon:yes stop_codon:yes gene_type:complete
MRIKKGDTIKVMAGKDKGKTGKVIQVLPGLNRVSVEGINVLSKHLRSQKKEQQGQKIEFPSPIQVSNVMIVCPQCGKTTRVAHTENPETKAKARACKKCKAQI